MVLRLVTGSTAEHAIDRIRELLRQGKLANITETPTLTQTHEQALSLRIPLSDLDTHPVLDLAIDGADEVDPDMNLVKASGLRRRKWVGHASGKCVVLLEIYAHKLQSCFEEAGCVPKLHSSLENGKAYATDNGNYIVDL
ncbi:Ribose 5-phosphate isomerase, type A [Cynara cardunculus var. scolymus]|uniref:ribose-5-phosphate isomerase n=1 Tax=Cynara cardunculus var. scolymus TaxID=59895 RepID=A0A103Y7W9_CYNCS|nr:Ribose 5-phosphate isomerase, type A [Cynara cardunculus var. scolymus]